MKFSIKDFFSERDQIPIFYFRFQLVLTPEASELTFTRSKSTTETLEKGVKYVQS